MSTKSKSNVHLVLRNTDALSGTPRILRRQAKLLENLTQVSVISDNFHSELSQNKNIKCLKTFKWPKNGLFQRQFFDWQAHRKSVSHHGDLVIGHGDSLIQDILFMHVCVHKGADLNPEQYKKNISIPFHRMIFEQAQYKVLVCNSKMMKNDLEKRFEIKAPTYVLYPGYETNLKSNIDQLAINEIRNTVNKGQEKLIIGLITSGDLGNRGAYHLIRAAAKLPNDLKSKVSILIVGKEGRPEKLYQLASELGIRDLVTWMKPRTDVANLFLATDIVVHAAQMEAFGMSVLEAMALERPVITTQTVGCSELLPDIQKNYIISHQEDEMIAKKLEELIQDNDLRVKMGMANASVAKNHSWESFDNGFMEILNEQFRQKILGR